MICSCNIKNKNSKNPQFAINIENQKKEIVESLSEALKKGYINDNEYKIMSEQLTGDCDKFLLSEQALSCSQIDSMVMKSLAKFENININEELATSIALHYSLLSSSNQVHSIFKVGEYCNPGEKVMSWFESRQTITDKFNEIRHQVRKLRDFHFKMISAEKVDSVVQRAYKDIDKIESDSTLTKEEVEDIIKTSLDESIAPEMEIIYTHQVGNIYFRMARIKNVNDKYIDEYLSNQENNPEMQLQSDEEFKASIDDHIISLLEEGLINRKEHDLLKKHMLADVYAFLYGDENEDQLLKRVNNSLHKLKKLKLDTEDREFVAEAYYEMAKRRGINIADMVNLWLYGKDIMESVHNTKKTK